MLVHKADTHLTKSTRREPEDIVFGEVDAKWVHHPYTDALVITVKMANSLVHRMLVDNDSATDMLYWDAYRKTRLTKNDLSPTTFLLYGFTRDHMIPRGSFKVAVTVGDYPRSSMIVTEFLAVDCPSAFNGVIGRPLLKALRVVTLIYYLTMKFPTTMETRHTREAIRLERVLQ